ncbi:MAG: elongation factor G, partial [Clostridia bacterium]|nr:elongation factor G [Clostridia bacterium]
MKYSAKDIRNVAIVGHSGAGKTSLAEASFFNGGPIDRMGTTSAGHTGTALDAYTVWKNTKINWVDVPGFLDFEAETEQAMRAVGSAILVSDANGEVAIGAEKAIEYCASHKVPVMLFINGIDKENANFVKTAEAFREKYGRKIATLNAPIIRNGKMIGYVSIVSSKAYEFTAGGRKQIEIPEDMKAEVEEIRAGLMESAAENDEVLLDKFFSEGELSSEDIIEGVKIGIKNCDVIPVIGGSATQNMGVINLLNEIVDLLPAASKKNKVGAKKPDGSAADVSFEENAPFTAQVFKTVVDPFVGKLNYIRVFGGTLKSGMTVLNATTGEKERINQLYLLKGKKQEAVDELVAGDIGGVNKLNNTNTGDTLCDESAKVIFDPIPIPKPMLSMAIYSTSSGDEDKVFAGLNRLSEEDVSFKVEKDVGTGEMILRGQGETQLDVISKKLKAKFGCDILLQKPRIAYKETIRGSAEAEGKHKKQSGGAGQFGVVNIRFEPGAANGEFEFVDAVVGGAVPKNFIPAVEKGLLEAIKHGVLAGYPVFNLKATLFDGKYHPVDSKEVAFVSAAKLSYEEAMPKAKPMILEPVYTVTVTVPDSYTGDILGDMNKRRGRILGMDTVNGKQVITAETPLDEMYRYGS